MPQQLCVHGVRVPLSEEEVSPAIWNALTTGRYEATEARLVPSVVRQGDRILELGAGVGVVTAIMARTLGVSIWSYDANPYTLNLAKRVGKANGLVNVLFNHGLVTAGRLGNHPFYIREDFWMSSLIKEQGSYTEVIETPSLDVDSLIAAHAINVLVMDIEGAEQALLKAARLAHIERVFLELHDHLYGLAGVRDVFQSLLARNFSYDPRCSSGACVVFSRDLVSIRHYNPDNNL